MTRMAWVVFAGLLAVACKPRPGSDSQESNTDAGVQMCDDITPTGFDAGDVPQDFELEDAQGIARGLHEHCGSVVLIIAGAAW